MSTVRAKKFVREGVFLRKARRISSGLYSTSKFHILHLFITGKQRFFMIIRRNLEDKLKKYLRLFPVVAILGARQTGKTTLSKLCCPEWKYFDLENGDDFDFITKDFAFFLSRYPENVIIDEAQRSPQLFRELRGIIDKQRTQSGRFILTGSSSPDLVKVLSESLAGRIAIIEIGTLKTNEIHSLPLSPLYSILNSMAANEHLEAFQGLTTDLNADQVMHSFLKGGYPEPALKNDSEFHSIWMAQYETTYIQRDIAALFPKLNAVNYRRFIRILSELSGTIINRSEIGRTLCVTEPTIRDYLSIAEGTFIWRNIRSFEYSASKSVTRMPRGYLRDSGLLHHLRRVRDLDAMHQDPKSGAAFEGFLIEEIILGLQTVESAPWEFSFYRTRNGAEVDLILTSPNNIHIPIEIKMGISTKAGQLRSLSRFIEQNNSPYGMLINQAEEIRMLTPEIIQIPACYL